MSRHMCQRLLFASKFVAHNARCNPKIRPTQPIARPANGAIRHAAMLLLRCARSGFAQAVNGRRMPAPVYVVAPL